MLTRKVQPIAGVSSNYENVIEELYPSIGSTGLGQLLDRLYGSLPAIGNVRLSHLLFIPVTWPLGLLAYLVLKIAGSKYVVTNRAVKRLPTMGIRLLESAPLEKIQRVTVDPDSRLAFFRSGDVRLSGAQGETLLLLRGVSYPDRFAQVIDEARLAREQTAAALSTIHARKR